MKHNFLLLIVSFLISYDCFSQDNKKEYMVTAVGFYNLENLFDTLVDPDVNKILQDDFTPKGTKRWTSKLYWEKQARMAKVISELGTEITPDGVAILGVAEVENKDVLDDLVKQDALKNRKYKVVHYDSPDKRGIDVGLLYNPDYFKVESSRSVSLRSIDTTFYTRDQLLVSGSLNGEKVHLLVAHWPSRRGGEKRSSPRRESAAKLGKMIIDSIQNIEPGAKIIYMGDLNDDPTNKSVKNGLLSVGEKDEVKTKNMFNPWEAYYKKGIGTLAYRDTWNLFDQILVSPGLVSNDFSTYKYYKAKIHNKSYLINSGGQYKGYPFRTYAGGAHVGGYSDHFPVYIYLIKEKK